MSGNLENGWYLCSDGHMTSERSCQRIEAMKANRALNNHGWLAFVKFIGGYEDDRRVYLPHPGRCRVVASATDGLVTDDPRKRWELSCGHAVTLDGFEPPACCPVCGKLVAMKLDEMSGRFNEPRLMGNCENCYYATEKRPTSSCWFEKGTRFSCHRYPTTLDKVRGDYCGEFAWKRDASMPEEAL